ncbi:hypothetical protein CDD80_1194 [Ophiocordyceps camponoti-rufipedis]|uniref:Uncharacterized protein n=1 Tax=Ophiocordyceps camponoti-rufipedis TaxID=2004952 RepID=A0A2C5Z9X4_9HYPO|nr:hypothetical protein CDD80_1194 [Ophiocordyceps camponoti-rufipedis]
MSRNISSLAKNLKSIPWLKQISADVKNMAEINKGIRSVERQIDLVPALKEKARHGTVKGDFHETVKKGTDYIDNGHMSGQLWGVNKKNPICSFHCYLDGTVIFSQKKYNLPTISNYGHGSGASDFNANLDWKMNEDNTCAFWYDGEKWQPAEWCDEMGLWMADVEGRWTPWL